MTIHRRRLVGAAAGALALGAAGSALPRPAIAQQRYEWRMVTAWPPDFPGIGTGVKRMVDWIGRMSDGRLTIRLHWAGEIVPAFEVFDAVADGTAELGHNAPYYDIAKTEGAAFYTAFPFGLTAAEQAAWIEFGGGQALWDALYEPFGIAPFLAGNTGPQMFGWFRKEIRTVEDLRGLRMRTAGNAARVLTRLGATIVSLPPAEIFPNLQSGAIDAAELTGPYNDLAAGFHQVAPYYYAPGWQEPSGAVALLANRSKLASLPADLQAILVAGAAWANQSVSAEYTARSSEALRTLVQHHGVQLRELPPEVVHGMAVATNEVLLELMDTADPASRAVIDSYVAFRRQANPWLRFADLPVAAARMTDVPFGREG